MNKYKNYLNKQKGITLIALVITITIRGNVSNYGAMLASVATQKGEVVLNYTAETESLVDNMLKTKSKNGNVVKGELVT